MDGVSTNLALIFGTLLSSQGADASFVLTLAGFPPGFSCGISCFQPSRSDFPFLPPAGAGCRGGIRIRVSRSRRGQTLPGFLGPP
ncbi:hypothetical protein DEJ46_33170 [Streptomyces venezuelae]|uniref:Uncharacterized protein n=1 Tax=Streptomyces venezuelae TaxID=54571 RepID=A0A5P2B0B7_STRVZ|nr:hypothetical protein DEJ46_33170 [Streptomyces venezuelae]